MTEHLMIGQRRVGPGAPVYVVAEMSANHNQSYEHAVKIVEAAKAAGADAVKLQTYTADTLTMKCDNEHFRISGGTLWDGRTLHDLYKEAYTPWTWQPKLKVLAESLGMDFFSTPFDATAVGFLESLNVLVHKIASFELVDVNLIRRVAKTGKPIIASTGMATLEEIEEAVRTVREAGGTQLALLKCTSSYPAPPEEMNLRTIPDMAARFKVPTGLSDHTMGVAVPVAAVAVGACIVEKHMTLSRKEPGPDSAFSLEPEEFKAMVDAIRVAEKALGQPNYQITEAEKKSRAFRRSLFVVQAVKAGEKFTAQNVRSIRPGNGLHPRYLDEIMGKTAVRDIAEGTPLTKSLVQK